MDSSASLSARSKSNLRLFGERKNVIFPRSGEQ
jgi:hypothetical protein